MANVNIAPRRLGHLNMFVSNVERSAAFYRDVCGFKEVFREPAISMIFMTNGNTHHDLGLMEITDDERIGRDGHLQVRRGAGLSPGLNHLGWEMSTEAQLVAAYRRALAEGVKVNRTTDHQIAHSIYLSECNGHTFEFYADVIEDWDGFYASHGGALISGHWDPDAAPANKEPRFPSGRVLHRSQVATLPASNVAYAGLPVRSLAQSLRYYADVLGLHATHVDPAGGFAVLQGSAGAGGDVCLVEMEHNPPTRMLFGGVRLHEGTTLDAALKALGQKNMDAARIGRPGLECIVVLDPDAIPMVCSDIPAGPLMAEYGPSVVAAIRQMSASARGLSSEAA